MHCAKLFEIASNQAEGLAVVVMAVVVIAAVLGLPLQLLPLANWRLPVVVLLGWWSSLWSILGSAFSSFEFWMWSTSALPQILSAGPLNHWLPGAEIAHPFHTANYRININ